MILPLTTLHQSGHVANRVDQKQLPCYTLFYKVLGHDM
jgi:hypothetical protein